MLTFFGNRTLSTLTIRVLARARARQSGEQARDQGNYETRNISVSETRLTMFKILNFQKFLRSDSRALVTFKLNKSNNPGMKLEKRCERFQEKFLHKDSCNLDRESFPAVPIFRHDFATETLLLICDEPTTENNTITGFRRRDDLHV